MEPRRIMVFDTTLRDGEQSIGLAFAPDEKGQTIGQALRHELVDGDRRRA